MSTVSAPRRRVARHRTKDYWRVATHLMESARALVTLGDEEYGNAVGICLVHAVISANDAVTINVAEVRSSSEQHADAARLLQEVVNDVPRRSFGPSARSHRPSSSTSILANVFTQGAAKRLLVKAERFYTWAGDQLR